MLLSIAFLRRRCSVSPATARKTRLAWPYILIRDGFIERFYAAHTGYWRRDGELDRFSDSEFATMVDLVGGESPKAFEVAVRQLLASGDHALARRLAQLALVRYPKSETLQKLRAQSLDALRERVHLTDPFRFIVYAQLRDAPLAAPPSGQAETSERPGSR